MPTANPGNFILVDDAQPTAQRKRSAELAQTDSRVRPVVFARNFGHQIAITAGWDYARGEAVLLLMPICRIRRRSFWIWARSGRRLRGGIARCAPNAKRVMVQEIHGVFILSNHLSHYRCEDTRGYRRLPFDGSQSCGCVKSEWASGIVFRAECRHGWVSNKSAWNTNARARFAGETKYPFNKMLRLALNAITSFSYFPLQVATFFGFVSAGLAILAIPVVIYLRMAGSAQFTGQATTLIAVLFLGGVQLISLGILGEYIGRLYDEAKGRPLYIVRDAAEG